MRHLSRSSGAVGLALGMISVIVGLVIDSLGIAALGVIVLLTGLYARGSRA